MEIRKLYGKAEEAITEQVGGDHYKNMVMQPIQLVEALRMNYAEATILGYVSRHKQKGGEQDLLKAMQMLDLSQHFKIVGIRTKPLTEEDEGVLASYVTRRIRMLFLLSTARPRI